MKSTLVSACISLTLLVAGSAAANDAPDDGAPLRPAAQQEYWSQVERKDWSAAIASAQALVEQARAEVNSDPIGLVRALTLLGSAQMRGSDLAGAEASFTEALELAERREGAASQHTLDPLRGLGFTLAAGGRHGEAVPYLDRALLIAHRTHGLFHVGQQPILRQLANSLTNTGEPLVAERHVNYMRQVGERSYGRDDPRMIPLLTSVADWHTEVGNFDDGRRIYREAVRLADKKLGPQDLALVEPLRHLAASFTYELFFGASGFMNPRKAVEVRDTGLMPQRRLGNPRYIDTEGQRALLRALDVINANADTPPQVLIDTLVETGDWYQVKQDYKKAVSYYRQAAQAYLAAPDRESLRNPLAFPVRVYNPVAPAIARGNKIPLPDAQEVFVQLEFTVGADGLVKDAKVVESNVHSRATSEVLSAIRDARFRPRFENGEPVDTVAMSFREVFRARQRTDQGEDRDSEDPS